MSDVNLSDFKTLYLSTAKEYVQKMEIGLGTLKNNPRDVEALESVHRSAHSLKSQSLVMGYTSTGMVSHAIEIVFRKLVDEKGSLSEKLLSPLGDAIRELGISVIQIEESGEEKDLSEIKKNLETITGGIE